MGRIRLYRELAGRLVERSLDLAAAAWKQNTVVSQDALSNPTQLVESLTEASLVSASNQNPPLLWCCASSSNRPIESILPIVQTEDIQSAGAGFSRSSGNRVVFVGRRELGRNGFEVTLSLAQIFLELRLVVGCLGSNEKRQSQECSSRMETHLEQLFATRKKMEEAIVETNELRL